MASQVIRRRTNWTFHLSGFLCLDFANTVSWRGSGRPIERLGAYADLVAWGRQTGLLTTGEARRLAAQGARRDPEARRALAEGRRVREMIYRIFRALADGGAPMPADLTALNREVSRALSRRQVVGQGTGFAWSWRDDDDPLRRLLWPVVQSAAELLTSADVRHLRTCGSAKCGWIFLDTSRNRRRRWCDMRVCGNRAKVRRFYARRGA